MENIRPIDANKFEVIGGIIPDGYDADSYLAGCKEILDMIDNAPTLEYPKWTNVAEHLPQKPGKYLVYSKVGTMYTSRFDPNIHKRWPHFGKVGVTHWMERPEEPKENGHD